MKKLLITAAIVFSTFFGIVAQQISFSTQPQIIEIQKEALTLRWETNITSSTETFWGYTPQLEQAPLKLAGSDTLHTLTLSGLSASDLVYVRTFSVDGTDTAFASKVQPYLTASNSSCQIKVYFNSTVDTSVAIGEKAITLYQAIADTLVSYINRATESIDMAIYNLDTYNSNQIVSALNSAHTRGVLVRVVYDGSTSNSGIAQLNSQIGKIKSPTTSSYGIMHNKFVVIDAHAVDPNLPIVWTGSTNFTSAQLNTDANNVIILQDQSLALAFTLEFNEMFGSADAQPNASVAKFGPYKADNTPHEFNIGGRRVECFFSPTDGADSKIIEAIKTAEAELYIGTMLITRDEIARAIRDKSNAGVDTRMIVDNVSYTSSQDAILVPALGENFKVMGETGIFHHKYMMADPQKNDSDPLVLTGSHNWSAAARDRNDENTLIVHDQTIANLYFQEFTNRFKNGDILATTPICRPDSAEIFAETTTPLTIQVLDNDSIQGIVNLSISLDTELGIVEVNTDNSISYRPKLGFDQGVDSIRYKVCANNYPGLCDETYVRITVDLIGETTLTNTSSPLVEVFPTYTNDLIHIKGLSGNYKVNVVNQAGQVVWSESASGNTETNLSHLPDGNYYLVIISENEGYFTQKIVLKKNW
ncbi:MAG: T9SS type A sorting domain-containing protein [Bacteroidota bacterium]|nr:MAG: T9SS type A sorting domain-containing protein [Bacteroidota bacterium]